MTDEEKQALDELKQGVATLTQGVTDLKAGLVDPAVVEKMAADVTELQTQVKGGVDADGNKIVRQGFVPDDEDDPIKRQQTPLATGKIPLAGAERLLALQSLSPKDVERFTKIPAGEVEQFQATCDNVTILDAICQSGDFRHMPKDVRETAYFKDEFVPWTQAMDSTTAGEGDEFVPTLLSASLIDRISLELRVAALFSAIDMPSQPFEVPGRAVSRSRLGTKAEETADTGQAKFLAVTPGSRKVTMTAVKLGGRALVSKEAEEDAIIAMLPFIQEELVDFMAADLEDAIVNGDDSSPHLDSDVTDFTDPKDPRTAFNGIRHATQAAAKTDLSNAVPTVANSIRANRKKMGKYGIRPGDLAHLLSLSAYMSLLGDANVYTVDKYGPGATILAGELGRADGTPLIVSEYVRQDLNASGVFDGVTTTRTIVQTVNRRGFVIGSRRGLTVQVFRELYAESDQDVVQVSWRKAFTPWYPVATEFFTAQAFNATT